MNISQCRPHCYRCSWAPRQSIPQRPSHVLTCHAHCPPRLRALPRPPAAPAPSAVLTPDNRQRPGHTTQGRHTGSDLVPRVPHSAPAALARCTRNCCASASRGPGTCGTPRQHAKGKRFKRNILTRGGAASRAPSRSAVGWFSGGAAAIGNANNASQVRLSLNINWLKYQSSATPPPPPSPPRQV